MSLSYVRLLWLEDLLRVLRNGTRIKEEVDEAIDKVCIPASTTVLLLTIYSASQCGEVSHIRESIENARISAEKSAEEHEKHKYAQKGPYAVHRECLPRLIGLSRDAIFAEILLVDNIPSILAVDAARHHAHVRDLR